MAPGAATAQQQKAKIPVFLWEAKTKNGETKTGEMQAADSEAVNSRLRSLGYQPVKVKKKPLEIHFKLPGGGGVPTKDLVIFTRTFSTMIDAGLPLVQCLDLLGNQQGNPEFKRILLEVKAKVEGGSTFADALKEHPKVFDTLYVQLIAAGEIGGILDTILARLAAFIEKNQKLVRKVKGAMTYPVVVMFVGVAITIGLLLGVIPTFEKMFADMGGALPAPTQIVVDMSKWMQRNWMYVIGLIVAAIVSIKVFLGNPKGRAIWDKVALRMPVIGPVIQKTAVARFTRTLGTLISSGVPILDGLEVVAKTAGNKTIEDAIMYTRSKISEGKTIAGPLTETKVFPEMVVQMIGVGEASGAMDQMLNKIADFYDDEVDVAVEGMTSLIEPIMMVGLGGMCGGLVISMYLPIFSMAGAVSG